jgi:hypothetical protein
MLTKHKGVLHAKAVSLEMHSRLRRHVITKQQCFQEQLPMGKLCCSQGRYNDLSDLILGTYLGRRSPHFDSLATSLVQVDEHTAPDVLQSDPCAYCLLMQEPVQSLQVCWCTCAR